jgi:hypothetical protein
MPGKWKQPCHDTPKKKRMALIKQAGIFCRGGTQQADPETEFTDQSF